MPLLPGEKILSECGSLYATSRRLILYEERNGQVAVEELSYQNLVGVELVRKASHPMMVLGVLAMLGAIFLTITGLIFITAFLSVGGGAALLLYGSKGNVSYYQLHISRPAPVTPSEPPTELEVVLQRIKSALGIKPSETDERWRLDYLTGKSFIATVRNIKGSLPEL